MMNFKNVLFLAASGTLNPSHLFASANNFVCTVEIGFTTLEDKETPKNDISVPGINVLKYGIPAVFSERFDMVTEDDTWAHSNEFESYQMKDVPSEDDEGAADLALDVAKTVIFDSRSLRGGERGLREYPKGCYFNPKCWKYYMRARRSFVRNKYYYGSTICRLCDNDDDAAVAETNVISLNTEEERLVTLDHILGTVALDNLHDNPAHKAFEEDFCGETMKLKGFDAFKTIQDCEIVFRCRAATKEEESAVELDIRDNRLADGEDVLYSATAVAAAN